MSPLTPKQKKVLDFIQSFTERNDYPPSQQEIARFFGFRSLGTVQNYLVRLEREGIGMPGGECAYRGQKKAQPNFPFPVSSLQVNRSRPLKTLIPSRFRLPWWGSERILF